MLLRRAVLLFVVTLPYLAAGQPRLVIPTEHTDNIYSVVFHPDNIHFASGSADGTSKLWDARGRQLIYTVDGASPMFSADGKFLVTSGSGITHVYEVASGQQLYEAEGSEPLISPDAKFLLTKLSQRRDVKWFCVWEFNSGKLVRKTQIDHVGTLEYVVSPDARFVVSTINSEVADTYSQVWELATGKSVLDMPEAWNPQFTRDGKYLLIEYNPVTVPKPESIVMIQTSTYSVLDSVEGGSYFIFPDGTAVVIHTSQGFEWRDTQTMNILRKADHFQMPSAVSPDGKTGVVSQYDRTLYLVDMETQKVDSLDGKGSYFSFSQKGTYLIHDGEPTKVWQVKPLKLIDSLDAVGLSRTVYAISADEKTIVYATKKHEVVVAPLGAEKIYAASEYAAVSRKMGLSPGGKWLMTDFSFRGSHRPTSLLQHMGTGSIPFYGTVTGFSGDESIAIVSEYSVGYSRLYSRNTFTEVGQVRLAELSTGKLTPAFDFRDEKTGARLDIEWASLSTDGRYLMVKAQDRLIVCRFPALPSSFDSLRISERTAKVLWTVRDYIKQASFSNDGNWVEWSNEDGIKVSSTETGKQRNQYSFSDDTFGSSFYFSPSGNYLLVSLPLNGTIVLYNNATGKATKIQEPTGYFDAPDEVTFSPDEKYLAIRNHREVRIWDMKQNKLVKTLAANSFLFSEGSDVILVGGKEGVQRFRTGTWERINSYGFEGYVVNGLVAPDRVLLSRNSQAVVLDLKAASEILTVTNLDSVNWVVTHPSGLFDGTPGALEKLYFSQGIDIIQFDQLKERYYEPALWKKVIAGETLRNVAGMKSIELPPDVRVDRVDEKGYLAIHLTNRGGGIGEVSVFVNGKEIIKDARGAARKPDAAELVLNVFVGNNKGFVKGQENFIGVKAWNAGHWVVSRSQVISYQSTEIERYRPGIHILACGVSDYTGSEIDLKYAAKDAADMGAALRTGAEKLFGADRTFVYILTTGGPKEHFPTKANILRAIDKIAASAHPLDVLVMYLSGHGINVGGQDGDWYYLTQEAYTGNAAAYDDPSIRSATTLSSTELVELFKKVPSLKQVLVIDACSSGRVVENLMARRDIESSTLRALDRMRDRTGMHIITGCAADAVSYEASKYGQGVLTYSLLEGMRGAALREDQYIDINRLFQYSEDRVPELAEGIGGIQSPQVFSPQGSQSFDIGLLGDAEKSRIPIARIRPVFVRSNFQDEGELEDVLGLSKIVDESLNEVSSKGVDAPLIFVDVREYPDGCKLSGSYKKEAGEIVLRMKKRCGSDVQTFEIRAKDPRGLVAEIRKAL